MLCNCKLTLIMVYPAKDNEGRGSIIELMLHNEYTKEIVLSQSSVNIDCMYFRVIRVFSLNLSAEIRTTQTKSSDIPYPRKHHVLLYSVELYIGLPYNV